MKKRGAILFAAALTALLIGGCAGAKEETPQILPDPVMPSERDPEAKAAAEKVALGMAEALKSGDFEKFSSTQQKGGRMMPFGVFANLRKSVTRRFGKLTGAEYIGALSQGRVKDYMWKFVFEAPENSAAPGHHEIIYWVRVGFADGKLVVYGYRFDLH